MKNTCLGLCVSIFAGLIVWGLSVPAFSAIGPGSPELQEQGQVLDAIHQVMTEMNKADLGAFYNNPSFRREQAEFTRERAEGMRCYSEGKYGEALMHLDTADAILRSSPPDWRAQVQ